MKKIFVTGGCGFIGHHLVQDYLGANEGSVVYVVDDMSNPSTDFSNGEFTSRRILSGLIDGYAYELDSAKPRIILIDGDFAHPKVLSLLEKHNFEAVFHFAAQPRVEVSVKEPVAITEINLNKTLELAKACAETQTRLVFSSTGAIYGNTDVIPTHEAVPQLATNPYGLSKYCAEQYLELFRKLYGLDYVALRYFNVYGPGQVGNSPYCTAIAAWCHKCSENEPMRSDGDGWQTRDMVYVSDIVSANILCAEVDALPNRVYNVGTGRAVSNNWILEQFKSKGYEKIVHAESRAGDVRDTLADISLITKDLGWSPQINIKEGLAKTWAWWEL